MVYLIGQFWLWLLVALVLGLAVGWFTFRGRDGAFWRGLVPWALLLGVGAFAVIARLVPDGPGFWLDLGLLMSGAYVIGCFLGHLLKSGRASESASAPTATLAQEVPVEPMKAKPAPAMPEASEEAITGLSAPRGGRRDNLTCIYGIDEDIEKRLNALGIYHHDQIAALTPGQRRWLFRQLGHEGRFPSWWWRWKYDAEQILAGQLACPDRDAAPVALAAAPETAAAPKTHAKASAPAEPQEGTKPQGLAAAREGKADDLKRIRGIGPQNEGRLHALGIWHFDQIAGWSAEEVIWVGSYLAFPGRIERENWVEQAKVLASGAETEFSNRVAKGLVPTSADDGDKGHDNVARLDKPATQPPKGKS
jgi:predicted flap endonuclease-1-like 5' DNA nuclease